MSLSELRLEIEEFRLDNGLLVVTCEDHRVPAAAVNIWYGVGSRHEPPGRTGLAHLLEHLSFQAPPHIGHGQHIPLIESRGGSANAATWCDRTSYFEVFPRSYLELAVSLEAQRLRVLGGLEDQEVLNRERSVVKNEKRQRCDNQPYGSATARLHRALFPDGHPYHHDTLGANEDLNVVTLQDVHSLFQTHYVMGNAVMAITGDIDRESTLELVQQYFATFPRGCIPPSPSPTSLPPCAEHAVVVKEDVPTARVFVAYRMPPYGTAAFDAATLLATVLGTGRGSRLYRVLVHEKGLARPTHGRMADLWELVWGHSVMVLDVTARQGVDVDALLEACQRVVESLVTETVSQDELGRARALVAREWLDYVDGIDAKAAALAQAGLLLGDPQRVNTQLPTRLLVQPEEISQVASEVFTLENRAILAFSPTS